MRKLLRLETLQDCLELTRENSVAVLRIMVVFGYNETQSFKLNWTIPPGVNHNLWFSIYGNTPGIQSGKGNSSQLQLAHRVAHYLGFSIPPTRVPPPPPVDVVVTHPSGVMTIEEKKAMIALLQAQVDGEGKSEGNNNNREPADSSSN
jgi:hypothetical protein